MIDFYATSFKRVCIHYVLKKKPGFKPSEEHAPVEFDTCATKLTPEVEESLRTRLQAALCHGGRALKLEIGDFSQGTFFDLSKDLKDVSDDVFYERSKVLAQSLANAQKPGYPAGYFMLIDAIEDDKKPVVIVIKAEPHDAFQRDNSGGTSKIQVIKNLFLGEGTKLYKIAALFKEVNEGKNYPNDEWSSLLFDDQYRPGDQPSTYFWDDFLNLDIKNNGKAQTAYYYKLTRSHIENSDMPMAEKDRALDTLDALVIDSQAKTIDPNIVKENVFAPEHRAAYSKRVQSKFPYVIPKDTSLIDKKLGTHHLYFPHGVKITGDKFNFGKIVKHVTNNPDLEALKYDPNKTIIVIEGKPSKTKQK